MNKSVSMVRLCNSQDIFLKKEPQKAERSQVSSGRSQATRRPRGSSPARRPCDSSPARGRGGMRAWGEDSALDDMLPARGGGDRLKGALEDRSRSPHGDRTTRSSWNGAWRGKGSGKGSKGKKDRGGKSKGRGRDAKETPSAANLDADLQAYFTGKSSSDIAKQKVEEKNSNTLDAQLDSYMDAKKEATDKGSEKPPEPKDVKTPGDTPLPDADGDLEMKVISADKGADAPDVVLPDKNQPEQEADDKATEGGKKA